MLRAIEETGAYTILLPGSGTDMLLRGGLAKHKQYRCVATLEEAVREAFTCAQPGTAVLLSPGFASHNLFKNEYDRGEQFIRLIHTLWSEQKTI
jgi:UDP-N-acetylmuramoylalanine--D-glutamate ligase